MTPFEDIHLEWKGRDYVIRSNRVMGALARVEEALTLDEVQRYHERGAAPLGKIAMAYGGLLRYAGAVVTNEEVYHGMFSEDAADDRDAMVTSICTLLVMMVPPDTMRSEKAGKESPPGNAPTTAARSSKKRSRRRSAPGT